MATTDDILEIFSWAQLRAEKPPGFLIPGIVPKAKVGMVTGASGTGKTAFMMSLMCSVATGTPWCGIPIEERVPALYVALEGQSHMGMRQAAWAQHYGVIEEPQIGMVKGGVNFMDLASMMMLERTLEERPVGFLIIDTLMQGIAGGDPGSPKDMGKVMQYALAIAGEGATVIFVHHPTKAGDSAFLGAYPLIGNIDFHIDLSRLSDKGVLPAVVKVTNPKMRDAPEFKEFQVRLTTVEMLGGSALVMTGRDETKVETKAKPDPKAKLQMLAWKVLLAHYPDRLGWTAWFKATSVARGDQGLGNSTFSETVDELLNDGRVDKDLEGGFRVVFAPEMEVPEGPPKADASTPPPTPHSPSKGRGVGGVREGHSGSTPGAAGSNSTECRNEEKTVEYDEREPVTNAESGASESEADALVQAALKQAMDGKRMA